MRGPLEQHPDPPGSRIPRGGSIGLAINYAVRQAGFVVPFAWLPPLLVLGMAALIAWTIGGFVLVKRLWFWLWGAPWDAAGYIASKSSKRSGD